MTDPAPPPVPPAGLPRLAAALAAVQAELPELERDRTVTVVQKSGGEYSYSYATLANVTKTILPLLSKNGLAFTALPTIGSDGKMCLRYHLLHTSGEALTGEFPLSAEGGIQVLGGRITYAKRYCLTALVGIAADEDDEGRLANADGPATAQRRPPRNTRAPGSATGVAARPATAAAAGPEAPTLPDEPTGVQRAPQAARGAITPAMTRKLAVQFKDLEITDRDEALALIKDMIGRSVGSRNDLTFEEGRGVIDAIEKALQTENPIVSVIDIYHRTQGGQPAGGARSKTAAEALGIGATPDDSDVPPWDGVDQGSPA